MSGRNFLKQPNRAISSALVLAATITLALGSSSAASAATNTAKPPKTIYAITFSSNSALYRLSPRSHKAAFKGNTGVELTDVAFRGKTLYAISFTTLYRLSTTTGKVHDIGVLGVSDANALIAQPRTNVLYGADQGGNFFKVNPRTGHITMIGMFGNGLGSSGDLVFAHGHLYASLFDSGSPNSLLATVNVRTGAAKVVGDTGFENVYGLVANQGALYGATFNGDFLSISPRTGHGKLIWQDGLAVGGTAEHS
jgi:hypothetical protein